MRRNNLVFLVGTITEYRETTVTVEGSPASALEVHLLTQRAEEGGLHRIFFTGQTAMELRHFIRVATAEPLEIMVLGWLYSMGDQSLIVAGRFTALLPQSVREKAVRAIRREKMESRRLGKNGPD
jgi:hypothetical protein